MESNDRNEYWWIPDEQEVWTLATISGGILPNGCSNFMAIKTRKTIALPKEKCLPASKDQGIPEDLTLLLNVNQASILACTRDRFHAQKIYTSMGQVLMSVNPFRLISGLYGKKIIQQYEDSLDRNLPSHLYMVPSRAYRNMCMSGKNQSILISGESGAGKTEATKQCLGFLTEIAFVHDRLRQTSQTTSSSTGKHDKHDLSNRIIAASPILEAFGNAQTVRNPNSSRFGKWMILNFDEQNNIQSSNILSYLLEKSRVTQRDPKERNYHIFYQILRGLAYENLKAWNIEPRTRAHRYLCSANEKEAVDLNDGKIYQDTCKAFVKMGFVFDEMINLFKMVMAILQIGDIVFIPTKDGEGSEIANPHIIESIAKKLGLTAQILAFALCNRSIESGKSRRSSKESQNFNTNSNIITIQLNVHRAGENRDSLARAIYERIFVDIIARINAQSSGLSSHSPQHSTLPTEIVPTKEAGSTVATGQSSAKSIGLLDIFGFEIFLENSFEQLCINYCNEMLQHHFNYVIFTAEQALYQLENIRCETIEFGDNCEVIHEVESLFRALDEEARIPKGSTKTWFDKLKRGAKMNAVSFPTRKVADMFTVRHYAGNVEYLSVGFMEKNSEMMHHDLLGAMMSSQDPVMRRIFASTPSDVSTTGDISGSPPLAGQSVLSDSPKMKATKGPAYINTSSAPTPGKASKGSSLSNKSLSWRFVQQLNGLMAMLKKTESHFIRCIKSNDDCAPQRLDPPLVYKQLIYSGVFEVVKIQQSGLPCRLLHHEFLQRYRCLVDNSSMRFTFKQPNDLIQYLMRHQRYDLQHARVGRSLTFFKSFEQRLLESKRDSLLHSKASRLTVYLQRKIFHYLYHHLMQAYREFLHWNEELKLQPASQSHETCEIFIARFHRLCRYPILQHQLKFLEHELSLLDRRVAVIQDAKAQLAIQAAEASNDNFSLPEDQSHQPQRHHIHAIEEIISRAMELELVSHPIIIQCRDIIQQYYQALEFLAMVQRTSENGNKFRRASVGSNTLNTLSDVQLSSGIKLLHKMSVYLDAQSQNQVLQDAQHYYDDVSRELEMKLKPLLHCQAQCKMKFHEESGSLQFAHSQQGPQAFERLKQMIIQLEEEECKSSDLSYAFEDCQSFIILVEDYILVNDVHNALIFLRESSCSREENVIFRDQMEDFHRWIEVQMSPLALRALCQKNFVPDYCIDDDEASSKVLQLHSFHLQSQTFPAETKSEQGDKKHSKSRPKQVNNYDNDSSDSSSYVLPSFSNNNDTSVLIRASFQTVDDDASSGHGSSRKSLPPLSLPKSKQHVVSYEEVETLVNKLKLLSQPAPPLPMVITVGTWIIRLRKAFLDRDWILLEELVQEADREGVEKFIFEDYPECLEELNNCQWQVIYHGFHQDLLQAIQSSNMRSIRLDAQDWEELIVQFREEMNMIGDMKQFATEESCPNLIELIPILEKLIQLRSLLYTKELVYAEMVMEELLTDEMRERYDKYGLYGDINAEIEAGRRLMKKVDGERRLEECLMDCPKIDYLIVSQDSATPTPSQVNQQYCFHSSYDLSSNIDRLSQALESLDDMKTRFHSALEDKVAIGRVALMGRKYLQMSDEQLMSNPKPSPELKSSSSFPKESAPSIIAVSPQSTPVATVSSTAPWEEYLRSYRSAIQNLLDDKEYALLQPYLFEYELTIQELGRRSLVAGFWSILSIPTIKGEADHHVFIDEIGLTQSFHEYNRLIEIMKEIFHPHYPVNLQALAKFCRAILSFRKLLTGVSAWNDQEVQQQQQTLSLLPHGQGMMNANIISELQLVAAEVTARNHYQRLQYELEHMKMTVVNPSPNSGSTNNADDAKIFVDLKPLQDAMQVITLTNRGVKSKQLLSLAQRLSTLIDNLLQNQTEKISFNSMEMITQEFEELRLNPKRAEKVFDRIRVHNFLHSLVEILRQHRDQPEELLRSINKLKQAMKQLPNNLVIWLHCALLYCQLSHAMNSRDWMSIIDVCKQLDDCLRLDLQHAFHSLRRGSYRFSLSTHSVDATIAALEQSTDGHDSSFLLVNKSRDQHEYTDALTFIQLCSEHKLQGYQLAIDLKQQMEDSQMKRDQHNLSPLEALKARLREEDLQQQVHGVGHLRLAGFPDEEIARQQHFPLRTLWAFNFDAGLLRSLGHQARGLLQTGYSLAQLNAAGYSLSDLLATQMISVSDLLTLGASGEQLRAAGLSEEELLRQGQLGLNEVQALAYHPATLAGLGFSLHDLVVAGFDVQRLRGAGFQATEIFAAGLKDLDAFIAAGFSLDALSEIFPVARLRAANAFSFSEFLALGVTLSQLQDVGFVAEVERHVLGLFYQRLDGHCWRHQMYWLTDQPVRTWYGITTTREQLRDEEVERVVAIDLLGNRLRGLLPDELLELRRLQRLQLGMNDVKMSNSLSRRLRSRKISCDVACEVEFAAPSPHSSLQPRRSQRNLLSARLSLPEEDECRGRSLFFSSPSPSSPSPPPDSAGGRRRDRDSSGTARSSKASETVLAQERAALLDIFHALKGKKWKQNGGWATNSSVKNWFGVLVDGSERVVALRLPSNNLRGFLPNSLEALMQLQVLDLRFNQIAGVIPEGLSRCSELREIHLQTNKLCCSLPDIFSSLAQLQVLDLRSNLLQGQLPETIAKLSQLRYLGLRSNHIVADEKNLQVSLPLCKIVL